MAGNANSEPVLKADFRGLSAAMWGWPVRPKSWSSRTV